MDTESDCSVASKASREARKRTRAAADVGGESGGESSSDSAGPSAAPKVPTPMARRGGRGGTAARLSAETFLKKKAGPSEEDEDVAIRLTRNIKRRALQAEERVGELTAAELVEQARASAQAVLKCSQFRGQKGTTQKLLTEAAVCIESAVTELSQRTVNDEVRRLAAANARLQREMAAIKAEVAALKAGRTPAPDTAAEPPVPEPAPRTAPSSKPPAAKAARRTPAAEDREEELARSIMLGVGTMLDARLAAFEPLLPKERMRPPLAADRRMSQVVAPAAVPPTNTTAAPKAPVTAAKSPRSGTRGQQRAPAPTPAATPGPAANRRRRTRNRRGGRDNTVPNPPRREPRPLPPAPTTVDEAWTTVVRRGLRRPAAAATASATQPAAAAAQRPRPVPRKLRPPRSAAVLITLQPEAAQGGAKYEDVMREARAKIDLGELGIEGIRFRRAKAGGKLLEIPGSANDARADALAARLREVLPEGQVKVTRPMVMVDVRLSGLDDSVTREEVAAAAATKGGCAAEAVRVGEIRQSNTGMGTVVIKVPITAAKLLVRGRLLVGWVSARVDLLERRALRCYRCLEPGHCRAQCKSGVDRSDHCHRCGKPGHLARDCSAAPHCPICADAGKPAGHKVGSKNCSPPKKKKGKPAAAGTPAAVPPPQGRGSGEDMDVTGA
ncbi:hypothetical protein ABMA27_001014 [Loxostege sticticalis]|uniref:CCHC-type domain-containing protein n=1 Tax=Loxostege sticticalis TaxID=481309 RepID=A0ABR3I175_LOXSC